MANPRCERGPEDVTLGRSSSRRHSQLEAAFGGDAHFCALETLGETKNAERENESTHTLSEDIYSTQDSLLGDINLGNYSEGVQNQPANTRVSSSRQFEPICKFHWIEAFNDEMIFQDLSEAFSSLEKPELQSHEYNTVDAGEKPYALEGENPLETRISENQDQLVHEHVRKSRSLSLNYYRGETQPLMEKSLARSTVVDVAFHTSQPQSFLRRENGCASGESSFDTEDCLGLLDLRTDNEIEEPEVSSKEIQHSGEISETSGSHQQQVTEDGVDSLAITPWSPAGISKSRSQDNCTMPDRELSLESLEPLEEDMALNEALQRLKQINKKQEMQIQELHGRNLYLENRVKELQTKVTKQQVFADIINKLKENIEELIDDKYNVLLEKNDINKKFQDLQEVLANTKKHLQETKKDKETLQLQVKKIKIHYVHLQERYVAEIQQKNRLVSQYLEIEKTLSKKDEELQRLQRHKGELEKATSSALNLLKREKETRKQEILSFQEEFQKREKEYLKERRKLKSRVEKLTAQVKNLLFTCEKERAKTTKFQQQVDELGEENMGLWQQSAKGEVHTCTPNFEIIQSREQLEEAMEPDGTQDITNPDAEHCQDSKKTNDIMLQKLKSLQLQKRDLDKELLKHKNRIATLKELIANEKALQHHTLEVTNFDVDEARNARDAPVLLAVKLDKYHNLNEELDFLITKLGGLLESKEDHYSRLIEENDKYRRHVGSLINKVTSYEEIIKCADQRLEISHSQIAHLEERNRHLEDLIRMPKEKARRPSTDDNTKPFTKCSHVLRLQARSTYQVAS
ncbi:cancer-associated gene 1 protein [Microtus oregoni]|uniref:cancer-associated gene 1 protein n=1 Tax=Microtus oregoni TaxID=111838 RepID=UPI001BB0F1A9|nr:cancer-associated gene 1 protein [Microtus oregoni]